MELSAPFGEIEKRMRREVDEDSFTAASLLKMCLRYVAQRIERKEAIDHLPKDLHNKMRRYMTNQKQIKFFGDYKQFYPEGQGGLMMHHGNINVMGKCGLHKRYRKDGSLRFTYPYKYDVLHGVCEDFFADGSLQSRTEFEYGQRNGSCKEYWPGPGERLMIDSTYHDDKMCGISMSYDRDGNETRVQRYNNGQIQMEILVKR